MAKKNKFRGREINGILLLDKPVGITSNDTLQRVKRLYKARKAGHTGSLDKMASGLLPICLGEATKFSGFLLEADKHYLATCKLGIKTSTGDAAGEVTSINPVTGINRKKIEKVLNSFKGEISQTPPMYSALKHQGKRLYQLAYQGINVERKARNITIKKLVLLEYREELIKIEVICSKGTYIRTLSEDIGEQLGCGAHVVALRRIGSGPFNDAQMITLDELVHLEEQGFSAMDQQLIGIDSILQHIEAVEVEEDMACYLHQGQAVMIPRAPTEGLVRFYSQDQEFLGIGEVLDDGRIKPKRLIQPGKK